MKNILKNLFTFLWHNKLTGTMVGSAAGAGYAVYILLAAYAGIPMWADITIASVAFAIFTAIGVFLGGEKLSTILQRLQLKKSQIRAKLNKTPTQHQGPVPKPPAPQGPKQI